MKNKKIKFIKSINVNDPLLENDISEELSNFLDLEDFQYVISEDYNGFEYSYVFFDEFKANMVASYFEEIGILLEYKDITDDVLNSLYKEDEWLFSIDFPENFFKLENFLKENLTLDIILDKIGREGEGSLYPIEKEILLSFREK